MGDRTAKAGEDGAVEKQGTRLHKVAIENNIRATRKLASRRALRHLLNADPLVVPKLAEAELHLKWPSLVVRLWCDRGCGWEVGRGCRRVAVLARVVEIGLRTVVNRLEHLGTHKRTAGNDAFQRDHLTQLGSSKMARADMMVTEGTAEADTVRLVFDLVLLAVVHALDDL